MPRSQKRDEASSTRAPDAVGRAVPAEDSGLLPYADPTGDRVVQLLTGRDVTIYADSAPIFVINSALLLDLIQKHVTFAPTRRGNRIRAHKRNAPLAVAAARGENQNPIDRKEN
ncbi:hypothetical protein MICRO8M_90012 [Microbacterium sp. 8M]|uniref:hypothetical protein n=1 Tax=Microbacterium sp. 8M TaxID=2653153 RepID=UPI0012EEF389|nr:hypothetical protein [Microbacterium sp. 8M]VXC29442.1 hypothetical protein MICRO8M_90012 [Microbacterium sp. 8M]